MTERWGHEGDVVGDDKSWNQRDTHRDAPLITTSEPSENGHGWGAEHDHIQRGQKGETGPLPVGGQESPRKVPSASACSYSSFPACRHPLDRLKW